MCRLNVDGNRHILITEFDVDDSLGLQVIRPHVPSSSELADLEALLGIYDPKCGPPKVDALEVC